MIYLIITASLHNRQAFSASSQEDRLTRYLYAIEESLQWVSEEVHPIIVENNGQRTTSLETIPWKGGSVPIIYTTNNGGRYRNKGVNELLDLQEVIRRMEIKDNDIVVKLTGRYRILSSSFLDQVRSTQTKYDCWMKFYNVCSLSYDDNDCVLGLYALRAQYIKWLSWRRLDFFDSPEQGVARYVRQSGSRICPMEQLEMECLFSEDGRVLNV